MWLTLEAPANGTYMEAAETLFHLKDFLQASATGHGCIDAVHARRQRA